MKVEIEKLMGKRMLALLGALALACALMLTGCASQPSESSSSSASDAVASSADQAPAGDITVEVSVTGPDEAVPFEQAEVSVPEGGTAIDALKATGVDMIAVESAYGLFITSIAGIPNEGSDGWTYTVNDERPTVSAESYVLSPGDVVAWAYTSA